MGSSLDQPIWHVHEWSVTPDDPVSPVVRSECELCNDKEKSEKRYVIFDLYGTLVDWKYTITKFIEFYISKQAVEDFFRCDIERVSRVYTPYKEVLRDCLNSVAIKHSVIPSSDVLDSFVLAFAKSPPYPDVIYGLRLLKRLGYKTCILSNTDRDLIQVTLAGFIDLFDHIITAEDVRAYKPAIESFTRAYEILSTEPYNVVHVSAYPEYDLIPAERLGAQTVLVDRGLGYSWHTIVRSLIELPAVIE